MGSGLQTRTAAMRGPMSRQPNSRISPICTIAFSIAAVSEAPGAGRRMVAFPRSIAALLADADLEKLDSVPEMAASESDPISIQIDLEDQWASIAVSLLLESDLRFPALLCRSRLG